MQVDQSLFEWMRTVRRTIHANPELSYQEYKTSQYIQEQLSKLSIPFKNGWGGTGVLASLGIKNSSEKEGGCRHVGLRADMDGLPVDENSTASYASKVSGVMHACGHDGHVAMLLGAAALLQQNGCDGQVSCIFQPAEEHGNGAAKIIEEGILNNGMQAVFAGHIDTHFPAGKISVDEGIICSFGDPFTIKLFGQSGHAARPHEAKDAIVAGACLVCSLQSLVSRETDPNQAAVLTVGRFQAGKAHNVIANEALLAGTIRTNHPDVRAHILDGIKRIVDGVALQYGVVASLEYHDCLPAVVNSAIATQIARNAAIKVVGSEGVISQGRPSLGSEDFSFYQQHLEGCLVRFGAQYKDDTGPSHSTTFDFDEEVLRVGAGWLAEVASSWLAAEKDKQERLLHGE